MLHHQDDLKVPPTLAADVATVLAATGLARVEPTRYELLSTRVSVVARIGFEHGRGRVASAIVKHVHAPAYGTQHRELWPSEFAEEAAAYSFLDRPEVAFTRRPALYGVHPAGAIVLEDLGSAPPQIVPLAEVAPHLALVLARLHAATRGHSQALHRERERFGLALDGPDGRYDGTTATARRRVSGAALLGQSGQSLGVIAAAALERLLEPVVRSIETPGIWHACIHDDLANHRQCPIRDGRMLLLDFENARYAHALLDLAKPLVGKFERDRERGDMMLVCPGFERSLAEQYRAQLARAGGPCVDDHGWELALTDATIYTALVQVGHLAELAARTHVRDGLLASLGTLLGRIDVVLGPSGPREELRDVLKALATRVSFGRSLAEHSTNQTEGAERWARCR